MRSLWSLPVGTRSQCLIALVAASCAVMMQPVSSRLSSPARMPHSNRTGADCSRALVGLRQTIVPDALGRQATNGVHDPMPFRVRDESRQLVISGAEIAADEEPTIGS